MKSSSTRRGSRTNRTVTMTTTITEVDRKKLRTAAVRLDTSVPEVLHLLVQQLDTQWIREHSERR